MGQNPTAPNSLNRRQVIGIAAGLGAGAVAVTTGARIGGFAAPNAQGTPGASPGASPAASPAATGAMQVEAGDLFFKPKTLTIPANTDVTVTIVNNGGLQHDFMIDELGVKTELIDPGASQDVVINGAAGEYAYYCSVPGHRQGGMEGTLTIQ